jgi:hypothetical protein
VTNRNHGRLEGLLLAVVVTAASGLALGGMWRVSEVAEHGRIEACEAVATAHKDSLAQVISLALALVALRRLTADGTDPPA